MPSFRVPRWLLAAVVITVAVPASARAETPLVAPFDDAEYAAVANRLQAYIDAEWDEEVGRYRVTGGSELGTNSSMLTTHALAALHGVEGPARQDARARRLVHLLTETGYWVETPPPGGDKHAHAPGWVNGMGSRDQHPVFDAPTAEAIATAYRARRALGLSDHAVEVIRDHLHRFVRGPYWRYPMIRLNQFNWYVQAYAADATVSGHGALLASGMRGHLRRFVAGAQGSAARAGNLGPGLHFHYMPDSRASLRFNLDSAEYANIVASYTRWYRQARRAGMPRPSDSDLRLLRQWARRIISGYWTHGGFLNWDTGLGFDRWQESKKLGLAQQSLLGLATAPEVTPGSSWRGWAKYLLDRSLAWYDEQTVRAGGLPAPLFFGLTTKPLPGSNSYLAAARVSANALRAMDAGLGRRRAAVPPPLYSYDPDTGRVAVTTPAYSTAIIARNRDAFPYGGVDLARLLDGSGDVAANIGGRPSASFGTVVRSRTGGMLCASQVSGNAEGSTPIRLTRAPLGVGASASALARSAFAGPFRTLGTRGSARCGGTRLTSAYTFRPAAIGGRWTVRRSSRGPVTVEVLFPSWGRSARVIAVLTGGRRVTVGANRIPLRSIRRLEIRGARSGYRVDLMSPAAGAAVRAVRPAKQSTSPDPGPTAAIQIGRSSGKRTFRFSARITPRR